MPDAPAASPAPASAAPAQQAAPTTASTSPAEQAAATATPTTQTAPATTSESKPATTPATTPAEAKPQETKAAKPYELKLPKDASIDSAIATELAALAHKMGLNQEHAQAVAEFMNSKAAGFIDQMKQAQVQANENQVKTWDEALKADTEIGGEKIQANLEQGRRALERFADKEAINFLRETGLNSNPMLARIFVRVGKAMGEDRIAAGKAGAEANDLRSIYKSMPNA